MRNFLSTIFKTTEERLRNPFIGAFMLSFLIINWKGITILLFSEKSAEEKINYVSDKYNGSSIWLIPLAISIVYTIGLPYLMWLIEKLTALAQKERQTNHYQIKKNEIVQKTAIAEEEVKLENTKADYKEKSDLNSKINSLVNELNGKTKQLNDIESANKEMNIELLELENIIESKNEEIEKILELSYPKRFEQEFKATNSKFVIEFIEELPEIFNASLELLSRSKNTDVEYFARFKTYLDSGLLQIKNDEKSDRTLLSLTDKGAYYIQSIFNRTIVEDHKQAPW